MENTVQVPRIEWKIHFVEAGPLDRGMPGARVEAYAESSEDGRWLLVAEFRGYHKKPEDSFLTLYPQRVHRAGYMNVGKQVLELRQLESKKRRWEP